MEIKIPHFSMLVQIREKNQIKFGWFVTCKEIGGSLKKPLETPLWSILIIYFPLDSQTRWRSAWRLLIEEF
jgi:hypothetical protein